MSYEGEAELDMICCVHSLHVSPVQNLISLQDIYFFKSPTPTIQKSDGLPLIQDKRDFDVSFLFIKYIHVTLNEVMNNHF